MPAAHDYLKDLKGALGDKFDPNMDYCLVNGNDRAGTCARKLADGYEIIVNEIPGGGREVMILLGKKRV